MTADPVPRPSARPAVTPRPSHGCRPPGGLTLLVDADDTLWENNIYFLQVTDHFLDALELHGVDRRRARVVLLETERKNIPIHGYGSRAFGLSVVEAMQTLAPQCDQDTVQRLYQLACSIFDRDEMELRPGVAEALGQMARHHRLILVTKGDPEEQERKLARSGLRSHFTWVEVVAEKNADLYRRLIVALHLDPERTWMIGNSPKSDINPALEAGLGAVLVPHPSTWELELEELASDSDRLLVAESLTDVAELFAPPANDGRPAAGGPRRKRAGS